jgi:hypothetical protein
MFRVPFRLIVSSINQTFNSRVGLLPHSGNCIYLKNIFNTLEVGISKVMRLQREINIKVVLAESMRESSVLGRVKTKVSAVKEMIIKPRFKRTVTSF